MTVKCGAPPEHCKPKDATCTLRTVSERIPPYKCKGGKCSEPAKDKAQGSTPAPAKEMARAGEVGEEVAPENAPPDDNEAPSCGDSPKHCKPKGADCKHGKVSACLQGLRCDKSTGKCVDKAKGDQLPTDSPYDSEAPSDNDEEIPPADEDNTETRPVQDSSLSSSSASAARASSSASTNRGGTTTSSSKDISWR